MPEDASEEAPPVAREARERKLLVRLVLLGAALIAALALLSVLALRLPRIREGARLENCASNLRQIGLAIKQYAVDHNDVFPPSFDELYPDYIDSAKIFSCPEKPSQWQDIQKIGKVTPESTSFVYVSDLNDKDELGCVLAYCCPENHQGKGRNVLFIDTHVEWMMTESGMLEHCLAETRKRLAAQGRTFRLLYANPPLPHGGRRWPYWLAGALAAGLVLILALVLRRRRHPARA